MSQPLSDLVAVAGFVALTLALVKLADVLHNRFERRKPRPLPANVVELRPTGKRIA